MKRIPLTLAVSLAIVPALSNAQVLEEVIVTAQKKEETLTSAPVAVTLVSGQEIQDLSIFQADELNKLVTGMEVRFEGDSNVGVGLRGVGTFQQQSAPARVGVYMDDFYMASQAAFALGSMFDMSNVQILKGPQGTLYGQPSPTGAMILTTRDPNFDGVNGYVQGSYVADPQGYNLQGAVNIPLIEDSLAIRIAALSDDRETGTENINPVNKLDEERSREGVRTKLLWEPTDSFSAKLGYTYMESRNSDAYRILETIDAGKAGYEPGTNYDLEADDRHAISDNRSQVRRREESFTTLHLNWSIGDIDLKWFSGALDSQIKIINDRDRTDIPAVVLLQEGHYGDNWDANQHELRVSGNAFDIWDWTVGGYYQEAKSQTDVSTFANRTSPVQGVFNVIVDIPLETEIKAIFTHNTIALTENTELTAGLRYNDFDHKDGTVLTGDFYLGAETIPGGGFTDDFILIEDAFPQQCIEGQSIPGDGTAPCAVGAGDFGWEEWTGTVKLSHFFSDELNTYITYDRGFRPGAPNFDVTGVFQPDLNFYEGEDVDSIEIGAKGDLFDGRARYTAAVFYSVYQDYQVPVSFEAWNTVLETVEVPTSAPFVNVDEAVQQGVEADFRMMVTESWMVYGGFTYTNVEFTDGTVPCTDPGQAPVGPDNRYNSCDADGEVATAMPEWSGVLQSEYSWSGLIFNSDFYVSGLWSYKGETESPGDVPGRLDTDDFSVLDLYAGLRSDTWTAQVFIKNALDDDGVLSKRPADFGYNLLNVTAPQTVGFTASYNF
jgi:iron complex outermembrane receptor protein